MTILLTLIGAYVVLCLVVFLVQRRLQYFPTHRDAAGRGAPPFAPWRDASGDFLGYVRAAEEPRRVVLVFHGNGGEALDRAWYDRLVPRDQVLALVEYPGYGARAGSPTETTIYAAALQAFDEARARWPGVPVLALGESLGSAVASYLASERAVSALALVAPLSSATDVAAGAYPFLPVRWLLRDRFDAVAHLEGVQVPLRAVHGGADSVIPLALARRLVDAYRHPDRSLLVLRGVGHNDIAGPLLHDPAAEPFRRFIEEPAPPP